VTVGAGVLVIWSGAVVWTLVSAAAESAGGTSALREVRSKASIAALVEPSSREDLAEAEDHFASAGGSLDSPVLWPLRVLPVVGRHIRAADELVTSAEQGTRAADDALRDLTELTERGRSAGPERIDTLRDLAAVAGRAGAALESIDPGSPDALIGPLGRAVTDLEDQRSDAHQAAARLEATSLALAEVLDGPDPYLLLGANNAEMRNGSGMFLSAAEIHFDHGAMTLGDVRPTAELVVPEGTVPVEGDLAANWPWLDPGRDLRNLGLTADYPQSAELAVANWAAAPGGGAVAGAIAIDVDGVRSLLRVVGPVEVDGVTYTPDNVRGELLRQQYQRFEGDRDARRDQLGDVAQAIFGRLEAGEWKLEELATELSDAVQGRNLMVWSKDPELAKTWRDVHADGHLTDRSVSVGLLSRSAAKLDSWIDTAADLTASGAGGDRTTLTITYDITNSSPADGPAYLVGPNVENLEAGDQVALAVVNLPAGSTDVNMTGAEVFLQGGDGSTVVVAGELTVKRGQTARVTVTALLPKGLERVVIEPSARIPHTQWSVDGQPRKRDRRQTVDLDG
jgi:hypothetical protein